MIYIYKFFIIETKKKEYSKAAEKINFSPILNLIHIEENKVIERILNSVMDKQTYNTNQNDDKSLI